MLSYEEMMENMSELDVCIIKHLVNVNGEDVYEAIEKVKTKTGFTVISMNDLDIYYDESDVFERFAYNFYSIKNNIPDFIEQYIDYERWKDDFISEGNSIVKIFEGIYLITYE